MPRHEVQPPADDGDPARQGPDREGRASHPDLARGRAAGLRRLRSGRCEEVRPQPQRLHHGLTKGTPMSVTLEDARRIIAAAEKRADEIGQPMNIAVVDAGGNLVAHVRQDGAWIGSIEISISKAWTSKARSEEHTSESS